MASESEDDDAQAELQIQTSLQHAVVDSASVFQSHSCEAKIGSLDAADGLVGCGGAGFFASKARLSPRVAPSFSSRPSELATSSGHADGFWRAASDQSVSNVVPHDDVDKFRWLGKKTRHTPPLRPEANTCAMKPVESEALMSSPLHSEEANFHFDQEVNSSADEKHQTTNVTAGNSAVPFLTVFPGTTPSTFVNPWSKSAISTEFGSSTKRSLSSSFGFGSQWSSTVTPRAEVADKVANSNPRPDLPNEHITQNQRPHRLRLLNGGATISAVDESSNIPSREVRDPTANNSETARQATPAGNLGNPAVHDGKHNEFFDGLHPNRLVMISQPNASGLGEKCSRSQNERNQSCWKPTGSNAGHREKKKDHGETKKKKANGEGQMSTSREHSSSKISSGKSDAKQPESRIGAPFSDVPIPDRIFKNLSKEGTQFAIDGIEGVKKRYPHLNSAIVPGKEWFFAWQEIIAILRTPCRYSHIHWQNGFSARLTTDFKVFSMRGPFKEKKEGKDFITKQAVLHVIDGPYFFKHAVPALAEFCRANRLAPPTYRHKNHPDGSCACSVRVGGECSIFGDDEEGYANRYEAEEDTARMALNALHREGVSTIADAITNTVPAGITSYGEPSRKNKRKTPMSSSEAGRRRVSSRSKRVVGRQAQDPRKVQSRNGIRKMTRNESDACDTLQKVNSKPSLRSTKFSPRTRAGLARAIQGVLGPQERANAICEYLGFQKPEYWTEGYSGGEKWCARFLSEQSLSGDAASLVDSVNGPQSCARLVEQKLYEKIYSGEIYLGDGSATFSDPAMDNEQNRQHFKSLPEKVKRLREKDEGLTLEELRQRLDRPDNPPLPLLPSTANFISLGAVQRPPIQYFGLVQDTAYESEDELPPNMMTLGDTHKAKIRAQPNDVFLQQFEQARQQIAVPLAMAGEEDGRSSSMQLVPETNRIPGAEYIGSRYLPDDIEPDEKSHLLPSGEHRYVSLPPFLDTPPRPSRIKPETGVKARADQDEEDDEVIFMGERTIEANVDVDAPGFVEECEIL